MPIGDIEDLADLQSSRNSGSEQKGEEIRLHPRIPQHWQRKPQEGTLSTEDNSEQQSFVPGTKKIYVKTWGCAHNSSDSEYMAGLLSVKGYPLTDDKKAADLWLLNSCTVKNPAEDHFRNEVNSALNSGIKVVASGCVSQGKPNSKYLEGISIIGVQQIDRVVEVVEETLKGNTVRLLGQKKVDGKKSGGASLDLPKVRRNPLIEIIAINTGCLNQCTYCKTKHARGDLGSYPIEEIVERAKQSFDEGVVEIWLTSEDTGAYGRDIGVTLPDLLWKLVEIIPDGCRLRLGMTNPPYIMDHLDEMAKILNHPRVYSFLHVPVQSGSDCVLRDMKRDYNSDEFARIVDFLNQKVPNINIITDIICGFPTETEEDFKDTMKLCQRFKFRSLFINQFFPRPGTPAARMKRIPTQVVKQRTRLLSEFFNSYLPFEKRIGEVYDVLVTENSHDGNYFVGHNEFYEQVLVPKDPELMGKLVKVKVIKTCKFSMTGDLLNEGVQLTEVKPLEKGQVSGLTERKVWKPNNKRGGKKGYKGQRSHKPQKTKKLEASNIEEVLSESPAANIEGNIENATFRSDWMYKAGLFSLAIAIFVRFIQIMVLASLKTKETST